MRLNTVRIATSHHQRRNQWRGGAVGGGGPSGHDEGSTIASRLFTFVISLVVVGAALVFATRLALSEAPEPDKPATPDGPRDRGSAHATERPPRLVVAAVEPVESPRLRVRLRSAVLLLALLTVLGVLAALLLLVGGAVVLTGLRNAVQ